MKYLPRAFRYLRPYWKLALVSAALIFFGVAAGLLVPWPFKFLVDNVIVGRPLPAFMHPLLGRLADNRSALLIVFVVLGLLITVIQSALTVIDNYVNTKIDQSMTLDVRSDLLQHVQRLSLAIHDRRRSGMMIYIINNVASAPASLVMTIPPMIQSVLMLVGMLCITLYINVKLALLSMLVLPLLYWLIGSYIKYIQPRLRHVKELEGESLSIVHESLSMHRVIIAFQREAYEYGRFRRQGELTVNARVRLTVLQTLFSLAVTTTTAIGTALVLGFGFSLILQGKLESGDLVVLMVYITGVYKPLETISNTIGSLQDVFVNSKMAFELLDTPPDIEDAPGAVSIKRSRGQITYQRVGFSYTGRTDTLKDISFNAQPGEVIAVVGPTGAGKTTLVSLLPRFYDSCHGRILLDGMDIRGLTLASLRAQISVVLQEPLLFSGTIAENIRYGRLDATLEEIIEAAQAANAHDFIMALPQQYNTELGERGAKLSGGERQRISVARAFLKDAPILILDEPTSSVDSKTEAVILDALDRLIVGRTTFMIAHRLSTIRRANAILVLDHGRIIEQGTHESLLLRGGLYKQLHEIQSRSTRRRLASVGAATPVLSAAASHARDSAAPTHDRIPTAPRVLRKKKIVFLGSLTRYPVAGAIWGAIQYLIGFQRLGYDVYYVEAHARTPSMLMESKNDDGTARAVAFLDGLMRQFDMDGRWAYHALHHDRSCYGMTEGQLQKLYSSAALLLNYHGATLPLPEHSATGRLVYLETDPVKLEIEMWSQKQQAIDFCSQHVAFFTWGLNYGNRDCQVPLPEQLRFRTSPPAVVPDLWLPHAVGTADTFTTIGNWRQPGAVEYKGETYYWSKHLEFQKFLDLPRRTAQPFELALSSYTDADRELLEGNGWAVRPALPLSRSLSTYQKYIGQSRGELTVAKDQNVRLRSGWFSERSAQYLAAGRPVITQETGFSNALPTGQGLFGFSTMEEILQAVDSINADYEGHCRAAADLARGFFSYEVVLPRLLIDVGL